MYRLLIVTGNPRVEENFASMDGWEAMGYKPPRLRKTFSEAVECMHKHHIDAIAFDDVPENAELARYLDENAPIMPVFELGESAERQAEIIRELTLLLNQLHTDDSNDDYDEAFYFQQARDHWRHRLLCGMAPSKGYIRSHQRLFRCNDELEAPCIYAQLSVDDNDGFLTSRWHYGSDRLETALRNFFGVEHNGYVIHVAVASPKEVRLVVCPKLGKGDLAVSMDKAKHYIAETNEQIENYLGLSMSLKQIRQVKGLTAFAANHREAQ